MAGTDQEVDTLQAEIAESLQEGEMNSGPLILPETWIAPEVWTF